MDVVGKDHGSQGHLLADDDSVTMHAAYLSVVAGVGWHGGVAVERVLALDVHRRQLQVQLAAVGDDLHAAPGGAAMGRHLPIRPGNCPAVDVAHRSYILY